MVFNQAHVPEDDRLTVALGDGHERLDMGIRVLLPLAAAVFLGGCTLPPHIAETMPDEKLCSVRKHANFHAFKSNDQTRAVVDAERQRRNLSPCPEAG